MGDAARVKSIDGLTDLKVAMVEFTEASRAALTEAESEVRRVLQWLGHDQRRHWEAQIKKRRTKVDQAETELFRARLFADSQPQACVERARDLRRARERLQEAEQKLAAVQNWVTKLNREFVLYRADVQPFSSMLERDMVHAAAKLERMVQTLQQYVALTPSAQASGEAGPGAGNSVAHATFSTEGAAQCSNEGDDGLPEGIRIRLPDGESRRSLPVTDLSVALPSELQLLEDQQRVPDLLELASCPAGLSQRVVVSDRALEKPRVFLLRCEPLDGQDSGWYIGDVSRVGSPDELAAHHLSSVVRKRPDLRSILTLPTGSVVLLDGRKVGVVYDSENCTVWQESPCR